MTPAELHAWVMARWQEKLDVARAVGDETWLYHGKALETNGEGDFRVFAKGSSARRESALALLSDWNRTLHVVAFDPAFSIAVCEAALRWVRRHEPDIEGWCPICVENSSPDPADWDLDVSCAELLNAAAPFVDRSDFPEELRHGR